LVIQGANVALPIPGAELIVNRTLLGGHPSVTRTVHARIALMGDGRYWLRDEHSTNGTYRNGQRVFDWVVLQPNDVLAFGQVSARFVLEGGAAAGAGGASISGRTRIRLA
jgi:hypothetical protein